jgi:hypothetical protein
VLLEKGTTTLDGIFGGGLEKAILVTAFLLRHSRVGVDPSG